MALETVDHAPTRNGGHTLFIVYGCSCGLINVFPHGNFALTLPVFQDEFTETWRRRGFRLEADHA